MGDAPTPTFTGIISFVDGANVYDGIVNGEPYRFDENDPERITHIPVHVREGNKNIIVAVENVILTDAAEMESA